MKCGSRQAIWFADNAKAWCADLFGQTRRDSLVTSHSFILILTEKIERVSGETSKLVL